MRPAEIHRFFETLARELDRSAVVILTGAGAAALQGGVRPSRDLDFAIRVRGASPAAWKEVEAAVARTEAATGIAANFAEDIDRWGMISLLDYDRRAVPYRRFGPLRLLLMHPAYWSIGKLTRYLESDIADMAAVFRSKRVPWRNVVRVWRRALSKSPRSTALAQFQHHASHFLKTRGPSIWGKEFDPFLAERELLKPLSAPRQ
jgi:hypothetical protein